MSAGIQWGLQTILGPILLAAVLLWAILHNRTSRRRRQQTEEATRRNYAAENARDTAGEKG